MIFLKNIVIIGPAHPLRGGIAAFNERLAGALLEAGYHVRIETFSLQYPGFLFPGKTQYSASPPPDVPDICVSVNSVNPFNWMRTGKKIRNEKPDMILTAFWMPFMGPCLGTLAGIIRKNRHSKVVALVHNFIPHEKHPGDKAFTRYFSRRMDGYIAMSKAVLKDIQSFDKSKPAVFSPHPLYDHYGKIAPKPEARKKLGLDPDGRYLLFFGIIRDYKGLDLALKAMTCNKLKEKNIKLIIAGEFYSDQEPYKRIIEENGLSDNVVLHNDYIPDGSVADYFNAADMIVQPYKSATQSGITQIGFHFEKPMLVTNVGGLGEIIPDGTAGYVTGTEPSEIADAIADFYDHNREPAFIEGVKVEKIKYSWKKMVETVEGIFEQIAGSRSM